ncbi:MAG: hypothetical protein WD020_03390 [Acidimicrobiia bacterium]
MHAKTMTLALAMVVAACSPSTEVTTTSTTVSPTTIPPTTTTTTNPAVIRADLCDALKVAAFDLDAEITTGLQQLGIAEESDLDDAAVGRVVVQALVGFYDELGSLATTAPDEISDPLATVAEAVDPWREALEGTDTELENSLESLDPASLRTPELSEAVATLATWTEDACGAEIPIDAEEIMSTTVFAAMLGALGSVFGDLGDDFLDFSDEETLEPDSGALAFGDDPLLDDLYSRCGTGDGQACRDLYYSAYGEYELWGQTCGASIPLRQAFVVDCAGKFATEPVAYGGDFVLDTLWDECEAANPESCDGLFAAAPFSSEYETFGASCGGTRGDADIAVPCTFLQSAEVFGYGDDPAFDALWNSCSLGDPAACDDLFFQTPINSAYESFGRICGDLTEVGRTCENAAAWLGGPVG